MGIRDKFVETEVTTLAEDVERSCAVVGDHTETLETARNKKG